MSEYTSEQIGNYIIKNYPTSCLANTAKNFKHFNDGTYYFDDSECEDFFYYEKLGWCGCGDPDSAKRVIRDYLRILYDDDKRTEMFRERFKCSYITDNPLLLCLAYTLDNEGFTEHGSSINGCWISEEGKMFLWLLNQNKELN